jgi:hypothetical protein
MALRPLDHDAGILWSGAVAMDYPNPVTPNGFLASWLNRFRAAATANRLLSGPGYKVRETAQGTTLDIEKGAGGSKIQTFKYKSMQGDYLVCRSWDGTTEGASDVYVGKATKLRHSITSETIDGTAYAYSAYSLTAQTRVSTPAGGAAENQIVVPRYLANDIIYAMAGRTFLAAVGTPPNTTQITLMDLNIDGRAWSEA